MLFSKFLENSTIFLRSKKFSKIPIFCSEKCSAIFKILKKLCDNNLIEWIGTSNRDPRRIYKIKD